MREAEGGAQAARGCTLLEVRHCRIKADAHTVCETPQYLRDCVRAGVSEEERAAIVQAVSQRPMEGDRIEGSGGVLKRRFAGRGKGKSGGYRAIIAYLGEDRPVYLLALFGKGERATLSDAGVAALKTVMKALKSEHES
jgi:hypothetical protein